MSDSTGEQRGIEKPNSNLYRSIPIAMLVPLVVIAGLYYSQTLAERGALEVASSGEKGATEQKSQYEIAKLAAEIRQIRSDTFGSLFWLKLLGVLITVVSALGGYLVGQSQNTQKRIEFERQNNQKRMEFEHRKDIDAAYQSVVQELSDKTAPVLRATGAVKLGAILKSFPKEWDVEVARQGQMVRLTKEILAAALAIEDDPKVLKTLSIALVVHKPFENTRTDPGKSNHGDARNLDLSGAKANYAYWAKVDFSYTDFYMAQLEGASLRLSILDGTQFYSTNLSRTVLSEARGDKVNFKFSDLRNADLTKVRFKEANFEGAKVYGIKLTGATLEETLNVRVDYSKRGDGSEIISVRDWLLRRLSESLRPEINSFAAPNSLEIPEV